MAKVFTKKDDEIFKKRKTMRDSKLILRAFIQIHETQISNLHVHTLVDKLMEKPEQYLHSYV
jgi:hypothetical protein